MKPWAITLITSLLVIQLTACEAVQQAKEDASKDKVKPLTEESTKKTENSADSSEQSKEDPSVGILIPRSEEEIWTRLLERYEEEGMTYLYDKELVKGFRDFKTLKSLPLPKGEVDKGQILKDPKVNTLYEVDLDGDGKKEEIVYYCLIRDQQEGNYDNKIELWEGGFAVPEGRQTTSILQIGQVYYFLLANAQEPYIEDMQMAGVKDLLWIDFDFDNKGRFYVVDLDKNDDKKEVVTTLISAGVVWQDAFIRYEGGGIRLMGKPYHGISGYEMPEEQADPPEFELPGDRTLQGVNISYAIQTFMVTENYILNDRDEIEAVGEDYEELSAPGTDSSDGSSVELLMEFPAYEGKNLKSKKMILKIGKVVFLKVSKDGKWVYLKDATGQKGWISVPEYDKAVEGLEYDYDTKGYGIFRGLSYAG